LTAPESGKANSIFVTGTTSAEAVALPEEEEDADGCDPESSATVGSAVGADDAPHADNINANNVSAIKNFRLIVSPVGYFSFI
jgi:hypothetical protein